PATRPATAPAVLPPGFPIDTSKAWLLHVPGIAGESHIDHTLFAGMRDAGFAGPLELYDWTGLRKGLAALINREQNEAEAQKVADKIVAQRKRDPNGQIVVTGHSGGTGIVIFALEKLPPGVTVDGVLLLSPALSPDYDLSAALSKVRGRMYVFSSNLDLFVLGLGTKVFGTIDRKQGESAGRVGFNVPANAADPKQYVKLIACPYERAWVRYENIGDHVGVMSRPFSRYVLSPLILSLLPGSPGPMTRPTTGPVTKPAATRPAK
ncbi:MAG TPA: hypothetical protein VF796_02205, partial [Humisphaera sp.]